MTLAIFAVFEQVRLATGTVSNIGGLWDLVRRAMGSSGLPRRSRLVRGSGPPTLPLPHYCG